MIASTIIKCPANQVNIIKTACYRSKIEICWSSTLRLNLKQKSLIFVPTSEFTNFGIQNDFAIFCSFTYLCDESRLKNTRILPANIVQ